MDSERDWTSQVGRPVSAWTNKLMLGRTMPVKADQTEILEGAKLEELWVLMSSGDFGQDSPLLREEDRGVCREIIAYFSMGKL